MKDLFTIVIISLFCNGWYLISHGGNIFEQLRLFYLKHAGGIEKGTGAIYWEGGGLLKWLYSPLFGCVICMASIWGTIGYFILETPFVHHYPIVLIRYPVIIISVACGNLIIKNLYDK